MALFVKQDFSPPLLSGRWFVIKCRPNLLLHCRTHVLSILESGLLFREDSAAVEEMVPGAETLWAAAGGGYTGWLTRGERVLVCLVVAGCATILPMRMNMPARSLCLRLGLYVGGGVAVRLCHRRLGRGTHLHTLLTLARDYTSLTRRTMACLKEYSLLHRGLGSVASVSETTSSLLRQQQTALALLLSRSCSALLGNMPALHHDLSWDAVGQVVAAAADSDDSVRTHHAFLVLQSSTLKTIALAHFMPPLQYRKIYGNQNERLYWLHNKLLPHICAEYRDNYETLDRMYRLLKNYNVKEPVMNTVRKTGLSINSSWMYSDVHALIARAGIELRNSLDKCVALDTFLDTCSVDDKAIDLKLMNADLDGLVDQLLAVLKTVETSQIKLKKIQYKFEPKKPDIGAAGPEVETNDVLTVDAEPEARDEVYFFVKTEDDEYKDVVPKDTTTGPGEKEKEATKIVLNELRRKLVKREDVMRHREKIALAKTMPELKDNLPEFPRQININKYGTSKFGYLGKLTGKSIESSHGNESKIGKKKVRLFRAYKIHSYSKHRTNILDNNHISKKKCIARSKQINEYVFPMFLNLKKKMILSINAILVRDHDHYCIAKLVPALPDKISNSSPVLLDRKCAPKLPDPKPDLGSSSVSDELSDIETSATNKTISESVNEQVNNDDPKLSRNYKSNEARNLTAPKEVLDSSASESDSEYYRGRKEQHQLLRDMRRNRVARKKNYPARRGSNAQDESMKPVEYNFGTGLALASVLNLRSKMPVLGQEEVFVGDGEVSSDSGNDEGS